MHHRLLVLALVVREVDAVLLDRLREADRVAVAEDPAEAGDQPHALAVALRVLHLEVLDRRLGNRPAARLTGRAVGAGTTDCCDAHTLSEGPMDWGERRAVASRSGW